MATSLRHLNSHLHVAKLKNVPRILHSATTSTTYSHKDKGQLVRNRSSIAATEDVKPFSAIPGPKGWPVVGNLFGALRGGLLKGEMHKYNESQHLKYGPIYKEKMGPGFEAVNIMDPADIEHVLRNEGKYPQRSVVEPFLRYREERGKPLGMLIR